jgi:phosphate transport system substrate-binding protein
VSGDKNAIGYVSLAALTSSVKAIKVDGVEPTVENIVSKSYKVARPFLYLTKGEPQALAKQFIDFVMSADGQAIVQKAGLVSTR